jgi:hypothetical protein
MRMNDAIDHSAGQKKSDWWRPAIVAASLAGAAVMVLRGCRHRNMGWPIATRGYSYQVCLSCGAKRLFDEASFAAYGPYRYDLGELIGTQDQ